jgi:phosphatidylglycerophosphate synthase
MTVTSIAVLAAAVPNPLNNIVPNFTIFGTEFTQLWQKLIAGLWGLAIIVAIVYLILGVGSMAAASGVNANPMAHQEGRRKAIGAAVAIGVLAALGVIVGAILNVVS